MLLYIVYDLHIDPHPSLKNHKKDSLLFFSNGDFACLIGKGLVVLKIYSSNFSPLKLVLLLF